MKVGVSMQYKEYGDANNPFMMFIHGGALEGGCGISKFTIFPIIIVLYLS